jgi:hypothetical protein
VIVNNRMLIKFADSVEPGFIEAFTRRLVDIFNMVTTSDHVGPRNIGNISSAVARCEARTISNSTGDPDSSWRPPLQYGNITVAAWGLPHVRPTFEAQCGTVLV